MESRTERCTVSHQNGRTVGFAESATIVHEGRSFTNLGAYVDPMNAVGYPHFAEERIGALGEMRDWSGQVIGSAQIIGSRPAVFFGRRSWIAETQYFIRATIKVGEETRVYSGRGFGSGMIWKGRRSKR